MKYIRWFEQLRKEDIAIAGGKGANLGELTTAQVPVPPGFVVLAAAYYDFLDHNDLRPQIRSTLQDCDVNDIKQLRNAAKKIRQLLSKAEMPHDLAREIVNAYHELGEKNGTSGSGIAVAVRSSATAEDLPEASFAGQQESFLNIIGDANVLLKIRECWESLFGERSIFYRQQKNFDHFKIGIAVPVQMMVQSEVSGVMFTVDPITKDKDKLIIEAIWGLGDYIVQGVVTPDHFEISKSTSKIIAKQTNTQEVKEIRSAEGVRQEKVDPRVQSVQKLSDENVLKLAEIGKKIHQHYFFPQDIEWAYADHKLYITQSRPITTLDQNIVDAASDKKSLSLRQILKGAPAAPGLVTGPVRIIPNVKQLDKIKTGDILVTEMTTPDFVPAMKRAAGIITDRGGLTSHAAIVSRELGVACVVGTTTATKDLKDGMIVTINGSTGQIYAGGITKAQISLLAPKSEAEYEDYSTATKLYVNLAEPELAEKVAQKHVDGVGLLRAEFMIAGIGIHPKKMIADGRSAEYVDKLATQIEKFCKAFFPRPVIYRATDFKTNEYRSLKGGELFEPEEPNPMLGFRGAYRYIKSADVFNLELEAIKKVRNKMELNNLWLMIPFVSTVSEMIEVKKIVAGAGLYRSSSFKLFMMVEIPSNVILLDDFIDVGLDGVSIGSNDLTMLILGIDRDNAEVAPNFDERNPAVMWALEKTVRTCVKRGIMCSICGQAPSQYPEIVEKLVEWGVSSISVNPDAIARTRDTIYHMEKKHITSKSRNNK